ncbi:MAG TPA: FG-GAP-like repeat-containing protein, partial [Pirellulaceae bacterium]|nr:FG-GAP-like repeat-containing protein [Pirellulaceae bacterium]
MRLLPIVALGLLLPLWPALGRSAEVAWKRHTVNAASEFPACAALDVDHDGDLDIYSGGWWYEAPSWKQHKVREVEVIRGRFDDYANLPLDCNGDGWVDLISVNYRSGAIYWIEHPAGKLGQQEWQVHLIDKPGPSETGRLHDLDDDGDLDILPNGTTYAAWY